jgi:hypothetical protein
MAIRWSFSAGLAPSVLAAASRPPATVAHKGTLTQVDFATAWFTPASTTKHRPCVVPPLEGHFTTEKDTRMPDPPPYPGTPRWVKVFGILAIGLVLLVAIVVFTGVGGPHGPGRHMQSGDAGGGTAPSSVTQDPAPSGGGLGGCTPPEGHP